MIESLEYKCITGFISDDNVRINYGDTLNKLQYDALTTSQKRCCKIINEEVKIEKDLELFYYSSHKVEWRSNITDRKLTFAGIKNKDNDSLDIGISECGNNDHFNRKLGRKIALGRANKKPIIRIGLTGIVDKNNNKKLSDLFVDNCKKLEEKGLIKDYFKNK